MAQEPYRKMIGLSGGEIIKHVPGRLSHEVAKDKNIVVAGLVLAITKAYATLGINPDPKKITEAADLTIKKVLDVYPSAMIEDLAKAIEMASFGEIKIEGQLSNISAANIFGWYKILRMEHGHLMKIPMVRPPELTISDEEKKALENAFTRRCIFEPETVQGGFALFWDNLIEKKIIQVTREQMLFNFKIEMVAVFKMIDVIFKDQRQRDEAKRFRNYVNDLDGGEIDMATWSRNPCFVRIAENVKKKIAADQLSRIDKEEVFKKLTDGKLQ